jgi:hypothetical protein
MKRFAFVLGAFWILTAGASAQELPGTFSVDQNGVTLAGSGSGEEVPEDAPEETKVYDKKVGGKVWLEATAGPSRFNATHFRNLDLTSIGLDLGFLIRAIPYVHPSIRLGFNYYKTTGGLVIPGFEGVVSNVRSQGGGASLGAGLRIPIVKWVSIAADFDYSIIGLVFQGNYDAGPLGGGNFTAGTAGTEIAGTFALTFHLGT